MIPMVPSANQDMHEVMYIMQNTLGIVQNDINTICQELDFSQTSQIKHLYI